MIGVVDYEAGNIRSVANALTALGIEYAVSSSAGLLSGCSGIILPGVGAAPGAMDALRRRGLVNHLKETRVPVLGICLGMQLLFDHSEEGMAECLGVIPGTVTAIPEGTAKIPHMGWNEVGILVPDGLWEGIGDRTHFYFAHSFIARPCPATTSVTESGITFAASVCHGNFYGVQFHPEKSGRPGLALLGNFGKLCRSFRP